MRRALLLMFAMLTASPAAAQDAAAPPADSAQEAPADAGIFRKLFTTLGRDLKQLPAKDNRAILLNGSILALAVAPLDAIATQRASSSPILKASFGSTGKALGEEWVQGGGALAAYAAGQILGKPRLISAAGDLIEAQIVSAAVTQSLKFAVNRTRPDGEARSFPSGHASAAFATATTLERHFGRKAGIPAFAAAVYTSLSRLQANSHYASDIVAGATIGLAVGRTATFDVAHHRVQVAPTAVPGGIGVTVTSARP
jgi:membrane-associated phospholipid phosphatase